MEAGGEAAAREGKGDAGGTTSGGNTKGKAEPRRARQRCWSPGFPSPEGKARASPPCKGGPGPGEAAARQGGGEGRRELFRARALPQPGSAAGTHHTMP